MKKNKRNLFLGLIAIWLTALIMLIFYPDNRNYINSAAFMEKASIKQNEDKVGAKIKLKEAIHGTKDITYRYIIKTDCDKWNFESRYMTKKPLNWVDGKTSAVEVLIYDIQIRYKGTVYASGTYYTVPLLDNLASEDIPLENWEENLIKQAYQAYISEPQKSIYTRVLKCILLLIPILFAGFIVNKLLDKLDYKIYVNKLLDKLDYKTYETRSLSDSEQTDSNKSWCETECEDCPHQWDCSYSNSVQKELEELETNEETKEEGV